MDKTNIIGGLYGIRTGKSPQSLGILSDHHPDFDDFFYVIVDFLACHTAFLPKHLC